MMFRLRRSAGLLLALFAGHLTMVIGGSVCTTPGMSSMAGAPSAQGESMASMASMASMVTSPGADGATAEVTNQSDLVPSDHAPCSSPSPGSCIASMPCVTALGARSADELAGTVDASPTGALALTVDMPVSSGSAPDLPPPRA